VVTFGSVCVAVTIGSVCVVVTFVSSSVGISMDVDKSSISSDEIGFGKQSGRFVLILQNIFYLFNELFML
jgi:hypothetical protein